jgi:myo-inositol-1(or 4)-monophosphatase
MSSYGELSEISLRVAKEAGQLLLAGFRTKPRVDLKGPVDLVTEWDRKSEALIRKRLAEFCPGVPILGEEEGGALSPQLTFCCDPLDGTTNFVHGHPFFGVSIGVLENGVPLAGAVFAPVLNWFWSGARDHGAYRNGEPCAVSRTSRLGDALVGTGFSPARASGAPHNNFDAFMRAKRVVRGVRRCGAACIDLCFVADGTYDGFWERALHAWDVVAGSAIVLAAGGQVTALDGTATRYEIGHLVASNGLIHDGLLGTVGENPMQVP